MDDSAGPDIALAHFDDAKLVAFQLEGQAVERLGNRGWLGNSITEHRRPLLSLNFGRLVDVLHDRCSRDDTCVRELANKSPAPYQWSACPWVT